jgi:hypothetical protein
MVLSRHTFTAGVFIIATVISGLLLGHASDRWGASSDALAAEHSLNRPLPNRVGNWRMRKEQTLEQDVLKLLRCKSYLARVYEHDQTGDLVTITVLVGPAGPLSVHTPEICYSSRDYVISKTRNKYVVDDNSGKHHEFWDVALKARDAETSTQRVLYGWASGDIWNASEHPRFAYAGAPYLYKLQLAARSQDGAQLEGFDMCQDFLRSFLVQLQENIRSIP